MSSPEHRRRKALEALRNDAFDEALQMLEQEAIDAFTASALHDREAREISYFQHLGIQKIRQTLENWSATPKGTATHE